MYEFTENMKEISGFGGSYEDGCRAMIKAGAIFLAANPSADPKFKGFKGVYGLIDEDNEDAKALTEAVLNAPFVDPRNGEATTVKEHGATGAMHHASIMHCLYIKKNGWNKYVEKMSKP